MNKNPWIFEDRDVTTDGEYVLGSNVTDSAGREVVMIWRSDHGSRIVVPRDISRTLELAPTAEYVVRAARALLEADTKASWSQESDLRAALAFYDAENLRLNEEQEHETE